MIVGIFFIFFAICIYFSYDDYGRQNKGDAVVYALAAIGALALALGVSAYNAL